MKFTVQVASTDDYNGTIIAFLIVALTIHILYDLYLAYQVNLVIMDQIQQILQAIGYHTAIIKPLLPMYLHLLLAALFPIYTGAHASLSRPSSAAKPPERKKRDDEFEDDESEQGEQKMEGLSPGDAILLPLFGGASLTGLYFLIKWLEDPAILNKILNWYFSTFGVLALARLLNDSMTIVHSFIFPTMYVHDGHLWQVDGLQKKAKPTSSGSKDLEDRDSPLPGSLSTFPFPALEKRVLWTLRALPSRKFRIRIYIHNVASGTFKIGSHGLSAIAMALILQLYFNLIDKPWWLTNLLGFSFAYTTLQMMSPTTSWTGTLILGGLFLYDIYFVFFTPLMVTVATKLDIPAKLLFPRPGSQGMSMLGLGDVVLPGMMIGFALRFDLYLFYLPKQVQKSMDGSVDASKQAAPQSYDYQLKDKHLVEAASKEDEIPKAEWLPATGSWGERYWTRSTGIEVPESLKGGLFPKTYFHATITGYIIGMVITLLVMQIFGHAQPALLYLVPGTLGALWGTALIKGDIKTLWAFTEADEDQDKEDQRKLTDQGKERRDEQSESGWLDFEWIKTMIPWNTSAKVEQSMQNGNAQPEANGHAKVSNDSRRKSEDTARSINRTKGLARDRTTELVFFSINLPGNPATAPSYKSEAEYAEKPALARRKAREKRSSTDRSAYESSYKSESKEVEWKTEAKIRRNVDIGETY